MANFDRRLGEGTYRMESRNGQFRGPEVVVDDRGVESALRAFKKLVLRDGILRELKRRRHYEKPGDRRRRKVREAARRRWRQRARAMRFAKEREL